MTEISKSHKMKIKPSYKRNLVTNQEQRGIKMLWKGLCIEASF